MAKPKPQMLHTFAAHCATGLLSNQKAWSNFVAQYPDQDIRREKFAAFAYDLAEKLFDEGDIRG